VGVAAIYEPEAMSTSGVRSGGIKEAYLLRSLHVTDIVDTHADRLRAETSRIRARTGCLISHQKDVIYQG
jgi:hypothetical protein